MDRVSIIISNYNYGQYLAESIESALSQTYENVEVVYIDDGSTDGSLDIAKRYSDVVVLAQKNQGVSSARNNAVQFCTGKFVVFLDADDVLKSDAVEKMMGAYSSEVGYVYGQMEYFGNKSGLFESRSFCPQALSVGNYICVTCLINKDVFLVAGGFDRSLKLREDWELFIRLWHGGVKGRFLPCPILRCRKHKGSSGRRKSNEKYALEVRFFRRYPRFFAFRFIKKPWRYIYYMCRSDSEQVDGVFGPSESLPCVVSR